MRQSNHWKTFSRNSVNMAKLKEYCLVKNNRWQRYEEIKSQDSSHLWGRTQMKHQDTLATANRPFMNVDDDAKGVHTVIT